MSMNLTFHEYLTIKLLGKMFLYTCMNGDVWVCYSYGGKIYIVDKEPHLA